jgi:hypothetical protein
MSSNKLEKFLHLVVWFIGIVWWCTDLQTLNFKIHAICTTFRGRVATFYSWFEGINLRRKQNNVNVKSVNWSSKIAQISETRLMTRNIKMSFQLTKKCSFVPGCARNKNLNHERPAHTFSSRDITNPTVGCARNFLLVSDFRNRKCGFSPWRENCSGMTQIMEACKFFF